MSAIKVVSTLDADFGLGQDTILALMVDYIDKMCDVEDFTNYMLNRAVETGSDGPDFEGYSLYYVTNGHISGTLAKPVPGHECKHPEDRLISYEEDGDRFCGCRDCGAIYEMVKDFD